MRGVRSVGRPIRDIVAAGGPCLPRAGAGISASTRIATRRGLVCAVALRPGDALLTRDSGYRPLETLDVLGVLSCLPVSGLWLGAGHGVLVRDPELDEILLPAHRLAFGAAPARRLVVSLRLDRHELILAAGAWIESALTEGLPARPRLAAAASAWNGTHPMRKKRVAGGRGVA